MSKLKKKKQQPSVKKTTDGFSFLKLNSFINYKYAGLVLAGIYFVVVGLISFIFHKVGDYGVETDFFWGYVPSAKNFLAGKIPMDAFRGPLYPIILGIFGFITGDFFHAGMLIAVISASVVIYVTCELLKNIFSPIIAIFVTILLTVNQVFIQYSYSAGTDMFFNALAAATLFFSFKDKELRYKNLIIAAFIGGLSYLTRYNGIFLASFILVILFVNYWDIKWTSRIKAFVIFVFVFIVTISPWGFHTLAEKGSFFYNENYKNIAYEVYGKNRISWDDFWFKESSKITSMSEVIFEDFGLFLSTVVGNTPDNFISDMQKLLGWHLGALVILGLLILLLSNPLKQWKERETGYYIVNLHCEFILLRFTSFSFL